MNRFRVQFIDSRVIQILRSMEERGWIRLKAVEATEDEMQEESHHLVNEPKMTDEEFEIYAAKLLAR